MNKNDFIVLNVLKKKLLLSNSRLIDIIKTKRFLEDNFKENSDSVNHFREIYEYCHKNKINIISYLDNEYPKNLKMITNPPFFLYCRGDIDLLNKKSIAIVGSRESSDEAISWVRNVSKDLIDSDMVLISGGAIGVDTSAHEAALDFNGKTITVLGSGLDNAYPDTNYTLFNKIAKKGLLISTLEPNKSVNKISLLERNKIISGMADAIIIATAKLNGGSMEQFKIARTQKKTIFVPNTSLYPDSGIRLMKCKPFVIEISDAFKIIKSMPTSNKPVLNTEIFR